MFYERVFCKSAGKHRLGDQGGHVGSLCAHPRQLGGPTQPVLADQYQRGSASRAQASGLQDLEERTWQREPIRKSSRNGRRPSGPRRRGRKRGMAGAVAPVARGSLDGDPLAARRGGHLLEGDLQQAVVVGGLGGVGVDVARERDVLLDLPPGRGHLDAEHVLGA